MVQALLEFLSYKVLLKQDVALYLCFHLLWLECIAATYHVVSTVSEDVILHVKSVVQLQERATVSVIVSIVVRDIIGNCQYNSEELNEDCNTSYHL
jgi:hypothetical protein